MTDDRVAGLPDAGTIQPGDPGHIETHDRMAELMQFAAERIGIILDPPPPNPAVIGEYGHVDAHNTLLANIEQIAREAGTAVGGPPAPILTNPEGGSVVKFTSGGEGAGGPTIAYGAEIEPNDHGETVTVEWDDPLVGGEVSVSGTSAFTDYIVSVYGVNIAGRGESATTDAFQLNYNDATGGTENIVDNYNGTGEKWKVHTFTGDGTFTVIDANKTFRLLVAGGGGGGGENGGGGGGQLLYVADQELSTNNPYQVVIAKGGDGSNADGQQGKDGGTTQFGSSISAVGGGGGGKRGGNGRNGANGGGGGPTSSGEAGHPGGTATVTGGNSGGTGGRAQNPQGAWSGGGGGGGGFGGAGGGGGGEGGPGGRGGAGIDYDISGTSVGYGGGGGGRSWAGTHGTASHGGGQNAAGAANRAGGGAWYKNGGSGVVIVAYQIGTSSTREIEQAEAEVAAREAGYATGYEVGVSVGIEQRNEEIRAAAEQVKEARPTKDKK